MNNLALVESKTLREEHIDDVEVLEKVKSIEYMTDDMIVSVEQAANYYEVGKKAINAILNRHNDEFKNDGVKVLKGKELQLFKGCLQAADNLKYAPAFTIIPRRALLRIGMLLTDSRVATQVRDYLLNFEHTTKENNRTEINTEALKHSVKAYREMKKTLDEVGATPEAKLETAKTIFEKAGIEIPVTIDDIEKGRVGNIDPDKKLFLNEDLMKKIKKKDDITFTEMAKKIGISRNHFIQLRKWHRPVGKECQRKITKTYPEYIGSLFIEK